MFVRHLTPSKTLSHVLTAEAGHGEGAYFSFRRVCCYAAEQPLNSEWGAPGYVMSQLLTDL